MKTNDHTAELIQRFLDNEMSQEERKLFEDQLKKDTSLQEEVLLYRKVNNALKDSSLEDFKTELNQIHREHFHTPIIKSIRVWRYAAAIVLLALIGSVIMFMNSGSDPLKAYDKYYEALDFFNSKRAGKLNERSEFDHSMEAYNNKQYQLAYEKLSALLHKEPDNLALKLYLGVSAIEIGQIEKAEELFKNILYTNDPFYIQEAEWYLSLIYIKQNKIEKARPLLIGITERNGNYAEKAQQLLDDLE